MQRDIVRSSAEIERLRLIAEHRASNTNGKGDREAATANGVASALAWILGDNDALNHILGDIDMAYDEAGEAVRKVPVSR